jgi:hypothetical protein
LKPPINRKLVSAEHVIGAYGDAPKGREDIVERLPRGYVEQRLKNRAWAGRINMSDLMLSFCVAFVLEIV